VSRKPTKRWLVCTVTDDKTGETVDCYYCKEDRVFWGRVGTAGFEHETQPGLERQVRDSLHARGKLVWRRVIRVWTDTATRSGTVCQGYIEVHSPRLGFRYACMQLADRADGRTATRNWHRDCGSQRVREGRDVRVLHESKHAPAHVDLPYSDENLAAIEAFEAKLGLFAEEFDRLLLTPERLLGAHVGLLLPDGEGTEGGS